jgi:glutaredoxin
MTPEEQERISTWNSEVSNDIELRLFMTQDQRSKQLGNFCDHLAQLAPNIRVVHEEGDPHEAPAIQVRPGLRYHAIPLGTELEPFLDALCVFDENASRIPESIRDTLEDVDLPTALRLYISQQCPFCPMTVRQLIPLATASELVQLSIIDCTLFPEMAQSDKIQSVPTLVLDEQVRWTGSLQLEELLEVMTNRDPVKLSPSSLERMIKEGNASQVAEMMLAEQRIFPALVELLVHEKMFVRLGAMVVMEEITDHKPELAARVIDPLWEHFDHVGDQVKGDIIYVLGESGNEKIAARLEKILTGSYHREVKEGAKDALEKIVKRP